MFSNSLKIYVFGMAASLIGAIVPGFLGGVIGLAANVTLLYALYQMRIEHRRLDTAFVMQIAVLILSGVMLVLSLIALASMFKSAGVAAILSILSMIIAIAALVVSMLASYNFYWGLDEVNSECAYPYPVGQIKWCFYIALIAGLFHVLTFFSAGIQMVIMLVGNGAQIYLMYKFWKAVETSEMQ